MFELPVTPLTKSVIKPSGCTLYYKRDDLLPYSFGGNKVRIAAEFLADLLSKDCDSIIGYGSVKSNLSRVVANMSRRLPGGGYIITSYNDKAEEDSAVSFNSVLVASCGVRTAKCLKANVAQTVQHVIGQIESEGGRPYYIYGDCHGKGNELVPMRAYMKVYDEIREQEKELGIRFDMIFLATGTAMTQSGLIVGSAIHGDDVKVVGISVARKREQVVSIISENCHLALGYNINPAAVIVSDDYLCGAYGQYSDDIVDAIHRAYGFDGVALDTCYTGKAFAGMCSYLEANGISGKNILFIHTGGMPLFFDDLANGRT